MRLEKSQERIFFFARFVAERAFRPLAVVFEDTGFDPALLGERRALHVERLVGGAFDDAPLFVEDFHGQGMACLLYTSPSPRDRQKSRMPSSA